MLLNLLEIIQTRKLLYSGIKFPVVNYQKNETLNKTFVEHA